MPGAGCVAGLNYRTGRVSTDAAKPSRPARVYLVLTSHDHVAPLAAAVRAADWHDAARSWQDVALVGPPTLEYAPYPKTAAARRRHDARQGTIDQDSDFQRFLESLTAPLTKPSAPSAPSPRARITSTPLLDALRDKKAGRDKATPKPVDKDRPTPARSGKENAPAPPADKSRHLHKADKTDAHAHATTTRAPAPALSERKRGNVATVTSLVQRHLGVGPAPNRRRGTKREVGPAATETTTRPKDTRAPENKAKGSHAALPTPAVLTDKTMQAQKKDRPTRAERRAFKAGATDKPTDRLASKAGSTDAKLSTPAKPLAPQILKKPPPSTASKSTPTSRGPPTEPAASRPSPAPAPAPVPAPAPPPPPPPPKLPRTEATTGSQPAVLAKPASTSKQAFLKHANASQGITEALIEQVMKTWGAVDRVEIDKRKGFAYVDFAEPAGLQKAMAASPIKIAQGAVQVLERKDKMSRAPRLVPPPTGPARSGHAGRGGFAPRGRGRGARGGSGGGSGPTATTTDGAAPTTPAAGRSSTATAGGR